MFEKLKKLFKPKAGEYICEDCGCEFYVDEKGNRTILKGCKNDRKKTL